MRVIKHLLLLVVLIKSSFAGLSQNSTQNPNDTICVTIAEGKTLYTAATMYKYTDSLLKITEAQVSELKTAIRLLEEKDAEQRALYERMIVNLNGQIDLLKNQVKGFEKIVRAERRKRFWSSLAGVVTTGAAMYLFITK